MLSRDPPLLPISAEERAKVEAILQELKDCLDPAVKCPICHDVLEDAVVLSCCGNSGCDACKYIVDNAKLVVSIHNSSGLV